MTKPNELTSEQAIERVERVSLSTRFRCDRTDSSIQRCGECSDCRDSAALRLVIEAAKRPTALSGEERKTLTQVLERHMAYARASPISLDVKRFMDALTAALSLASPFTEKEAEALKAYVEFGEANELCLEDDPHGLLDDAPGAHELTAKLDAYIESRRPRGI
jgi:hypothetical protein